MALCALRCAKWQRNGLLGAASTSCVFGGLTHLYYALREHDLQLLAVACTILKHPSNIFNPSNQHVEALSLLQMSRVAPCRTVWVSDRWSWSWLVVRRPKQPGGPGYLHFLEIGTSNFRTLVGHQPPEQSGMSVEALPYYVEELRPAEGREPWQLCSFQPPVV